MNLPGGGSSGAEWLFECLEVIDDSVPRGGALNMGIDEGLLQSLGHTPVLRLYRWLAPTVSFGCFEPLSQARAVASGRELVRRWTGGGIVEHGADATYSLLVPRIHPLARMPVTESYRLIHEALAAALGRLGSSVAPVANPNSVPSSAPPHACFANPVRYDLVSGERKVAGAAQRRTRQGLLHQGSVQAAEHGNYADLPGALASVLPRQMCAQPVVRRLTDSELMTAKSLADRKYASARWLTRF